MGKCECPARFSGDDEEQYRAHGCPTCVCREPPPVVDKIVLNEEEFKTVVEAILNPNPPTPKMIAARKRYLENQAEINQQAMDEHMVKTSSAKKL